MKNLYKFKQAQIELVTKMLCIATEGVTRFPPSVVFFYCLAGTKKMPQLNSVEPDNSQLHAQALKSEEDVIHDIKIELSQSGQTIRNKAIVIKLLERLELETDIVQLDIYRNALERVMRLTPDDLI